MTTSAKPSTTPSTKQTLQVMQFIWFAILVSATGIAYVAITTFAREPESSRLFPDLGNPVQAMMGAFSLVSFTLSFILPKFILNQIVSVRTKSNAESSAVGIYFVSGVVAFALAEASTLMGLTLTVFAHSDRIVFPGYLLTLIALFANRPSSEKLKAILNHHGIGREE